MSRILSAFACVIYGLLMFSCSSSPTEEDTLTISSPNILIAISDDQSFAHTSIAGYPAIHTPNFDRVAKEGIWFTQGFAASPGCSPSRAALLTGRNCWQLEAAGTHASHFDLKYTVFPDLLQQAGYHIGYTGKGWGPGDYGISGRKRNPAGPEYAEKKMEAPQGIANIDYAGNFEDFLAEREPGQPFYFWLGAKEPHRQFKRGIGVEEGKEISQGEVPPFLPDDPEIRSDMLDYCVEIEWFDKHLGRAIHLLEEAGN